MSKAKASVPISPDDYDIGDWVRAHTTSLHLYGYPDEPTTIGQIVGFETIQDHAGGGTPHVRLRNAVWTVVVPVSYIVGNITPHTPRGKLQP